MKFFRPGQVFSVLMNSMITVGLHTEINITTKDRLFPLPPSSCLSHYIGPILIRRFVVLRENYERCLCLGIHTYANRGCIDQPDQAMHAALYYTKVPAPNLTGEERMILPPIRMAVEHPSTAPPATSRIHFGRIFEVQHSCPVRDLGLIEVDWMGHFLSHFQASLQTITNAEDNAQESQTASETREKQTSEDAEPVDAKAAEDIRKTVIDLVGSDKLRELEL